MKMNNLEKLLQVNTEMPVKIDLYKESLEKMNGVLFISDNNMVGLSWVGKNFEDITGYKYNKWNSIGKKGLKNIFHPDDFHIFGEKYDYFMNPATKDKSHTAVYRLKHMKGHYIWMYINTFVISRNHDGSPQKTGGIMINLEELMIPSFLEKRLNDRKKEGNNKLLKLLSKREKEILGYISKGLSALQIAEILHLSKRTVESHKRNMQQKLGFTNSAALISFAIGAGV
jgi:DNA-binding CsgD family transcriptional regulator